MFSIISRFALVLLLAGCAKEQLDHSEGLALPVRSAADTGAASHPDMASAIAQAPPASKKVLRTIDKMMAENTVVVGGCWDYLNEAFNRAGYPPKRRQRVFKGKYKGGKYADSNIIQPGDWLYYVNHSYNDIEHSGLFIGWTDKAKREALIFSYAGEGRKNPARMRVYHIDQVYNILRARD